MSRFFAVIVNSVAVSYRALVCFGQQQCTISTEMRVCMLPTAMAQYRLPRQRSIHYVNEKVAADNCIQIGLPRHGRRPFCHARTTSRHEFLLHAADSCCSRCRRVVASAVRSSVSCTIQLIVFVFASLFGIRLIDCSAYYSAPNPIRSEYSS